MKLSLFKKLLLANAFYAVPVVVMVGQMVGSKNVNIDFARWEEKGNRVQRPLTRLLESIAQTKLAYKGALPGNQAGTVPAETVKKADVAFAAFRTALDQVGEDLQFTDEGLGKRKRQHLKFETVSGKWAAIKQSLQSQSPTTADDLTGLIADVRGLITHAGDTSNLILDPDLDSYYLMDITLLALPQTQDRVHDIAAKVGEWIATDQMNAQRRTEVSVMAALLKQSDLDRVTADFATVLTEDANFYGASPTLATKLQGAVDAYAKTQTEFLDVLNRVAGDRTHSTSLAEFSAAAAKAHDSTYRLWEASVDELDVLLQKRLQVLNADKTQSLAWASLALLVSCGLLLWVALSFNANMKKLLGTLKDSLGKSAEASGELVHVADELAQASTSQASAIQETAATLDEISSMAQQSKDGALKMTAEADHSFEAAEKGRNSMTEMNRVMDDVAGSNDAILSQVQQSNQDISQIVKIIGEIADKTRVIHDIVFQTKLLSFNASVEAARAGEHGKGFAVVAEEVGKLAQMSGNAAKEIGDMVGTSIDKVQEIVTATQSRVESMVRQGREKIAGGHATAKDCERAIETIVDSVEAVRAKIGQVAGASEEQAKGVDEISKAMHQLDRTVNENSELSKKTADYSRSLASQAQTLGDIVSTLQVEILGQGGPKTAPAPKGPAAPGRGSPTGASALLRRTNVSHKEAA